MSGSGVYGENKKKFFDENFSPKTPFRHMVLANYLVRQ